MMNATDTNIFRWAPEPLDRGTIGLVWSCTATIFLCTWSAIHPNLPADNESPLRIFWRRVRYFIITLLAPEWVILIALQSLE
jgi:hypothetical protein